MRKKVIIPFLTLVIFAFAAFLRLYGVNWDQGQHLHPDERFLTMVTEAIQWPKGIVEYLDASTSVLNPHNKGFGFFVYGTFPLFFTRLVTDLLGKTNYTDITLIGRQLSALFDLGTVVLVFLIAKSVIPTDPAISGRVEGSSRDSSTKFTLSLSNVLGMTKSMSLIFPITTMFFYAVMVLPIQLSHFYAVDTYLTFFITLSFYFLIRSINNQQLTMNNAIYLGISLALAAASKITVLLFLPIIIIGILYVIIKTKNLKAFLVPCFLFLVSWYLTFRVAQPYLFASPNLLNFSLNQRVVDNWKQLKSFDDPTGGFPPAVQWITTKPYIFPLKNMIYWGLGVPLGLIAIASLFHCIVSLIHSFIVSFKKKRLTFNNQQCILYLSLLWSLLLFGYQGKQFVKALRYFIPIYPFLALLSAYFITQLVSYLDKKNKSHNIGLLGYLAIGLLVIIYPLSFLSIYSRPITRVVASEWIYQNVPPGIYKADEHWDDGLPVSLPKDGYIHEKYTGVEFPLYWPDNQQKWNLMVENLKKVNYIFLTSNRLYGSIMTYPPKYPITIRYYTALFDGTLGFEKVAEFTSRPNIPIPFIRWCITLPGARYGIIAKPDCNEEGVSFVDDYADETFTVYDHPKVIIFKKVKDVDYKKVLDIQ